MPDVALEHRGPLIIVRKKKAPLEMPKGANVFKGRCARCSKMWLYRVGNMGAPEVVSDQTENSVRAMNIFLAYTRRGIGPCCMKVDDRLYIAANAGNVYYERLE